MIIYHQAAQIEVPAAWLLFHGTDIHIHKQQDLIHPKCTTGHAF